VRETVFDLASSQQEIKELTQQTTKNDFWDNPQKAKKVNQKLSFLEKRLSFWNNLKNNIQDLLEISSLIEESSTEVLDLEKEFKILEKKFIKSKIDLYLSGPFDDCNAILEIKSGAGGTEAQDWALMLMRMFLRFAERMNFSTEILEKTSCAEAGIKSALIEISGPFAFGYFQSEKGTHRLVRQSPFNAKNLRQTSFAGVIVTPLLKEKDSSEIKIDEKDLRIDTFRSSGAGGQHVNKTDSAIRITHLPTGIVTTCQNGRSQHQNKEKALQILKARLAEKQREEEEKKAQQIRGEITDAAWGNQIRSYVLHPYKMVKDLRTKWETSHTEAVLDGDLEDFSRQFLEWKVSH